MYLFELEFSSFPDICPGVGLLDHVVALFLVVFFLSNSFIFIRAFWNHFENKLTVTKGKGGGRDKLGVWE